MKKLLSSLPLIAAVLLMACSSEPVASIETASAEPEATHLPPTANVQKALTPDQVLADLMEGNQRYMNGTETNFDLAACREASADGQFPKAYILSCVDSRVPVEKVFDQCVGDIFVGRVAGNVENEDQLGSMEFASKVAGVKLIMVLGHEACGAVKGACDGVELGNLTALLNKIEPALEAVDGFDPDQRNSKNTDFVNQVIHTNVKMTIEDIRRSSPVIKELEKSGQLKIVGAHYALASGEVTLIN